MQLIPSLIVLSACLHLVLSVPNADDGAQSLGRRARILYNGERCSKSVQCFSYNCERARCADKKDVGASCYKNSNCKSGNCQNGSVCAEAVATATSTPTSSSSVAPLITTTVTVTVTMTPLALTTTATATSTVTTTTTVTSSQNSTPSDTPSNPNDGTETPPGGGDGGDGGSDGGSIPIGDDGGAIVFSPAPLPSISQIVASLKAGGDPFFNSIGAATTQQEAVAAQQLADSIRIQQAALQAQKTQYLAQKQFYANAPLPQSVKDSIDDQIDVALTRLNAANDRFNTLLDDLTKSIQDRANTLEGLRDSFRA